ncbi:hypothetical protein [Sporomusa sp.]|uniref:hypothetical protein n=1 Tax=Sporomusa sp. TaxID=2078658 RepID=UPI002CAE65FD|nr:hypothetical protein [Sporomusa sp.]MDF2876489.1 hypothetical protein [Sporomusa sp.]HWR09567.1 hypothetical protein [Sporomusa sp.]
MFLSYSVSIIIVSLALYGLWYVLKDVWNWFTALELVPLPDASFIILLKNMEYEVEDLMRYLVSEIEEGVHGIDAVVVDCGSDDLTPIILQRLAGEMPALTIIHSRSSIRPLTEAMPLCRGSVVHVLDLTTRLKNEEFMAVVASLLRKQKGDIAIRSRTEG